MKKLMYCSRCGINTVHTRITNGWVCWCGNETDEQEELARTWTDGLNRLTEEEVDAVHNFIAAAEAGDDYLGTHTIRDGVSSTAWWNEQEERSL